MSFVVYDCPKCPVPQLRYAKDPSAPETDKKCSRCGSKMKLNKSNKRGGKDGRSDN